MSDTTPRPDDVTGEHARRESYGRRDEDLTLRQIWQMIRRARWIGAFAIFLGTGTGWIGGQLLGPVAQRVATVDGRVTVVDSLHQLNFSALRAEDARILALVDELADATKLGNYLICTMTRGSDPVAVPAECNRVILDWRRTR